MSAGPADWAVTGNAHLVLARVYSNPLECNNEPSLSVGAFVHSAICALADLLSLRTGSGLGTRERWLGRGPSRIDSGCCFGLAELTRRPAASLGPSTRAEWSL